MVASTGMVGTPGIFWASSCARQWIPRRQSAAANTDDFVVNAICCGSCKDLTTTATRNFLGLQHKFVSQRFLYCSPGIRQWEILPVTPERQQIGIVRTPWLATLSGSVNRD